LFQLDGVTAKRGDRVVLRDVDVQIGGGATAIVGPSGAGKSTLLRLLNRLADPVAGTVRFGGRDVRELDVLALRRDAVLVPQVPAPLPGTVRANVEFGPSLDDRPAPDVDRCLELAGLDGSYAERDASRLSVGEQQRVMLARALALEPEALLLDEPTASLDDDTRTGVELTLVELHATLGVALVLVTHDRSQAARLTTRTLELRDGRVSD
jgi:putative ABC transport system ATP-binding protein